MIGTNQTSTKTEMGPLFALLPLWQLLSLGSTCSDLAGSRAHGAAGLEGLRRSAFTGSTTRCLTLHTFTHPLSVATLAVIFIWLSKRSRAICLVLWAYRVTTQLWPVQQCKNKVREFLHDSRRAALRPLITFTVWPTKDSLRFSLPPVHSHIPSELGGWGVAERDSVGNLGLAHCHLKIHIGFPIYFSSMNSDTALQKKYPSCSVSLRD